MSRYSGDQNAYVGSIFINYLPAKSDIIFNIGYL